MNARAAVAPAEPLPGWDELRSEAGDLLLARIAELTAQGASLDEAGRRLRAESGASGSGPFDSALLAAALTETGLRAKAAPKFGELSDRMLFTQAGLEQASRLPVAELHAERFAAAGCSGVADLGCGLGAESLAFLRAGLAVRAVELDPLTAEFARRNLVVQTAALAGGPRFEVLVGDATELGPGDCDGVFLDPARRTAGHSDTRRLNSPSDYSPPLAFAFDAARGAVSAGVRAGGVKLGPGFDRELIPEEAEAQWVSVDGQVVETGLWFGAAARPEVRRAAMVLGRRGDAYVSAELTAAEDSPDAEVRSLGEYLVEPDGAVIRARLIGLLAAQLDAGMIHPGIAYLTTDRAPSTPFGQAFRIVEELPTREKDLRRALAARGIGRLEIKKRGADVDPAALRTRLRLAGDGEATLILSRSAGRHVALLAERC